MYVCMYVCMYVYLRFKKKSSIPTLIPKLEEAYLRLVKGQSSNYIIAIVNIAEV